MTTSKIYPQSKQIEFSLMSMCLRHPNNIIEALVRGLDIECFYNEHARNMFFAVEQLHKRKAFIDRNTLKSELEKNGCSISMDQIKELIDKKVESSDALGGYVDQLVDLRTQRKLIEVIKGAEEITLADLTSDEKFSAISASISAIYSPREESRNFNELEAFDGFTERLQENRKNKGKNVIKSGFRGYDSQISMLPGTLHLLAGPPGSGKTAMLQQIVNYNAQQGKNVLVFSIEMIYDQLMMRNIQATLSIEVWKMHTGDLTDEEMNLIIEFKDKLSSNVTYNDLSNIDIAKLKSIANIQNSKRKIDLIAVDYLQKIRAKGFKNKHDEIGFIVSELSGLAKDLNVPVYCLAQLNREWKKNEDSIPDATNLAGSNDIEKEAASITFIVRPGQFDKTMPHPDRTTLHIAKNRFGNSNSVELSFNGPMCRFEEKVFIPKAFNSVDDDDTDPEFDGYNRPKKKKF